MEQPTNSAEGSSARLREALTEHVWTEDLEAADISRAPTIATFPDALDIPSPRLPPGHHTVLELIVTARPQALTRPRRIVVHLIDRGPDAA